MPRSVAFDEIQLADDRVLSLVASEDAIWAAGSDHLFRIDPATNEVDPDPIPISDDGFFVTYAFGSLWYADYEANLVQRLDPATGEVLAEIPSGPNPEGFAVADGSLWVANHRGGSVTRIDPATNTVLATVEVGPVGPSGPQELTAADGKVWVGVPNLNAVVAIDAATNEVVATHELTPSAIPCGWLLVDSGSVWTSSCLDRANFGRLDLASGLTTATSIRGYAGQLLRIADRIWLPVTHQTRGGTARLLALDPASGEPVDAILIGKGRTPFAAVVAFGSYWTTDEETGTVLRLPLEALIDG